MGKILWSGPFLLPSSAAAGQLLYEKGFFFVTFVWGVALAAALIKRWRDGGSLSTVKK